MKCELSDQRGKPVRYGLGSNFPPKMALHKRDDLVDLRAGWERSLGEADKELPIGLMIPRHAVGGRSSDHHLVGWG
jgi:hypothetical protein